MKHLGDITKINGAEASPVKVIIGGSPCQDLSIAGKRAGLAGERSGLFMEQIRIIKEMRVADALKGRTGTDIRPRFMIWENVPGAFSSNKGEDFGAVIHETIKIVNKKAPTVSVPGNGWPTSGCLYDMGGDWSIAWRVFDAQFWGVPQRRRRIALVADFAGLGAPEILFERESVSGYYYKGRSPWEIATGRIEGGAGNSSWDVNCPTVIAFHAMQDPITSMDKSPCISAGSPHGQGSIAVYDARGNGDGKICPTITGDHMGHANDYMAILTYSFDAYDQITECEHGATLKASGGIYCGGSENLCRQGNTVRRLTPLECERLQGFPDGWTDIGAWTDSKGRLHKESSDGARYKALGNSIAIPPWFYVLQKASLYCADDPTMASLFDGIGGFPYIWEMLNGKGTCVWASEIEEFPIAVTKYHFGGV